MLLSYYLERIVQSLPVSCVNCCAQISSQKILSSRCHEINDSSSNCKYPIQICLATPLHNNCRTDFKGPYLSHKASHEAKFEKAYQSYLNVTKSGRSMSRFLLCCQACAWLTCKGARFSWFQALNASRALNSMVTPVALCCKDKLFAPYNCSGRRWVVPICRAKSSICASSVHIGYFRSCSKFFYTRGR